MESQNPININISKDSMESKDKYNEFKEYVIRNNIELQNELKETRDLVKVLEADILEKENTEDKYDTRVRYMKGLLQNLYELKNEYSKITKKTIEKTRNIFTYKEINDKLYKKTFINTNLINFSIVLGSFIGKGGVINLALSGLQIITIIYCVNDIKKDYYTYKKNSNNLQESNNQLDDEIKEIRETIKKTEDASLSLDNWICEL